ncbi:MAG: tRNA (adenosine(37)-N6)-dimethylallyltransferase MiaA [Nitrospirae bacterium]|nr:tRNA (adenosine(37)-N6)-dimethylallyltransferase MiaA [Magnetococcales bacterium]
MAYDLLAVVGATASGKTHLGVQLARHLSGEIISADSRQVYRGLDVGTGKDLHEYGSVPDPLPYHLIDIIDVQTEFNVFDFQARCYQAIADISQRGHLPCLVGGSGLYLESILQGYRMVRVPENRELRRELEELSEADLKLRLIALQPHLHNETDLLHRDRLVRAIEIAQGDPQATPSVHGKLNPFVLGIHWPREVLRHRIWTRLEMRLRGGLVEEVQRVLAEGVSHDRLELLGLEYRWVSRYLRGEMNREKLQEGLSRAIGQFAKRQETWFRRMQRRGVAIHWLEGGDSIIQEALERCSKVAWKHRPASFSSKGFGTL